MAYACLQTGDEQVHAGEKRIDMWQEKKSKYLSQNKIIRHLTVFQFTTIRYSIRFFFHQAFNLLI